MEWWVILLIVLGCVLIVLLIALFGNKKLKSLVYELVCNAEKLVGQGKGKEKKSLVLESIEKITHGLVPKWLLEKMIEWGVKQLKEMLLEDSTSIKKHENESKK